MGEAKRKARIEAPPLPYETALTMVEMAHTNMERAKAAAAQSIVTYRMALKEAGRARAVASVEEVNAVHAAIAARLTATVDDVPESGEPSRVERIIDRMTSP